MPSEYEYDNESEGMREALERARDEARGGAIDLDALLESIGKGWDDEPERVMELPEMDFSAPSAADEMPSEPTGDESGRRPPVPPPEVSALPPRPRERWASLKYDLDRADRTPPPQDRQLIAKMKSVGWGPEKSARTMERPDWEQLQHDLQAAQHAADTQRNVGAMLHAAAPGFRPPADAGAGDIAAARTALDGARMRDQASRQQEATDFNRSVTLSRLDTADRASGDLAAMRQAEAERWRNADERARAAADARTKSESEKSATATAAREADASSLAVMKQQWLNNDGYAGAHGLTAADLEGIKTRQGWESFLRQTREKGSGKAKAPAAPPRAVKPGDYSGVPEDLRETVKAVVEGRAEAPKPSSRFGAQVLNYATQIDPTFDSARYGAYKKVVEGQATGKDVVAIDVAREHLKTAKGLIPENASPQFVNRIKQAVATGSGDPEFAPFIAAASVAAHELARVYGIEDQAGKEMVEHQLSSAQSPEQLHAVFDTFDELIAGKQRGLQRQRDAVAPRGAGAGRATVKMKFPNGKVLDVPADDVEEAKTKFKAVEVRK